MGKHIVRALSGSNTLAVLCNARSAKENFTFAKNENVKLEVGDVTDRLLVKNVITTWVPDAVVHLAALTGIARCEQDPCLAFSTNVFGTYNVISACVACKAKLVFISSREVYGETELRRAAEDDPLFPNNIYGTTKFLGERLVTWAACRYGLDYTILRLTNIYGPEGDKYNVQVMIREALTTGRIQIFGGGQLLNLIYVEDIPELIQRCVTSQQASNQTFNVGSNDDFTVEEIVSRLISILGVPVRVERKPMRRGDTVHFRPNLEKIRRTLGYSCKTSLEEGLRKTVNWYRESIMASA